MVAGRLVGLGVGMLGGQAVHSSTNKTADWTMMNGMKTMVTHRKKTLKQLQRRVAQEHIPVGVWCCLGSDFEDGP